MIVKTGTPARYIAMAAPDRIEWVPTSPCAYPSLASPRNDTVAQMQSRSILDVMAIIFPLSRWTVFTGVSGLVPSYEQIR